MLSRSYHQNCDDADPGTKASASNASRQLVAGSLSGDTGESQCQTTSSFDRVLELFVDVVDKAGEAVVVFKGCCDTEEDGIVLRELFEGKSNGLMDAAVIAKTKAKKMFSGLMRG